jgi:hypothetical protein
MKGLDVPAHMRAANSSRRAHILACRCMFDSTLADWCAGAVSRGLACRGRRRGRGWRWIVWRPLAFFSQGEARQ